MATYADQKYLERVPELSLKSFTDGSPHERARFVQEFFSGLKKYGFIVLFDHPIDLPLLKRAYELSAQFFNLPEQTKKLYVSQDGGNRRGYTPFGKEHAKDSRFPDLKEFWHVGRDVPASHPLRQEFPDNIWPRELQDFQSIFTRLYQELDNTGRILLSALCGPLEVDTEYFSRLTNYGSSVLRLLHYPPIPDGTDPNCIRAAAHEDINLITLLVSASASGLQLKTREGEWLPIETDPENIIVDSGDMLARITNEVIPSTTHRVVNPSGPNLSRYSMPFFMHPNPDAVLQCLPSCRGSGEKFPPILANDFLFERLREIGLTK